MFLESHEKGLVSFRVAAAGAGVGSDASFAWACGGGPQGTAGKAPDNPTIDAFLGGRGGLESGSEVILVSQPVLLTLPYCRSVLFDVLPFKGVPSSSRLTLSRDEDERRWEVKRGDFGCLISGSIWFLSPSISTPGTAGTGGWSVLSCMGLFVEDDRRLVNDLVLSADPVCGASAAVSFVSSNVSYADQRLAELRIDSVRLRSERSCDTVGDRYGRWDCSIHFPVPIHQHWILSSPVQTPRPRCAHDPTSCEC